MTILGPASPTHARQNYASNKLDHKQFEHHEFSNFSPAPRCAQRRDAYEQENTICSFGAGTRRICTIPLKPATPSTSFDRSCTMIQFVAEFEILARSCISSKTEKHVGRTYPPSFLEKIMRHDPTQTTSSGPFMIFCHSHYSPLFVHCRLPYQYQIFLYDEKIFNRFPEISSIQELYARATISQLFLCFGPIVGPTGNYRRFYPGGGRGGPTTTASPSPSPTWIKTPRAPLNLQLGPPPPPVCSDNLTPELRTTSSAKSEASSR